MQHEGCVVTVTDPNDDQFTANEGTDHHQLEQLKPQVQSRSRKTDHETSRVDNHYKPVRLYDATSGHMREDYWPMASRMLNGTHSANFISDLRQLNIRVVPKEVMRLIRRRYLSSLNNSSTASSRIEQISLEASLLAKWLVAFDVYARVINVARPHYQRYLDAENNLAKILGDVRSKHQQIEYIQEDLDQLADNIKQQVNLKSGLANSMEHCRLQAVQASRTRNELVNKRDKLRLNLISIDRKRSKLFSRCLLRVTRLIYINSIARCDDKIIVDRLIRTILRDDDS